MFPDTWIIKRQIDFPTTEATWGWQKRPTVTIYPIGDLHLGSIGCHEKEWADFVSFIANEPDSYICVIGDMFDNAVRNSIANPFDSDFRYRPMEAKNLLSEYLKPISDKVLCGVRGNHENRSVKETDTDMLYDVFCRLNIEDRYRAGTAFLYLQIGERTNGNRIKSRAISSYNIVVTHGTGGGKYAGSAINNQQRFGSYISGMDCLVTGHTHAPSITKPSKVVFDPHQNEIRTEPFACVQCCSWLAYSGYPLAKMLPPQTAWSNDVPQTIQLACGNNVKLVKATM